MIVELNDGCRLPLLCIGVVVSCTSAVGQVLRKAPNPGYRDVEKFALLFASVWGIWRDAGTFGEMRGRWKDRRGEEHPAVPARSRLGRPMGAVVSALLETAARRCFGMR